MSHLNANCNCSRRRKVRCDLGSVDNPSDPPCVRCRRESKECFFSATRRKRKADGSRENSVEDEYADDYVTRNGRKMVSGSPPAAFRQNSMGAPPSARSTSNAFADSARMDPGPPLTPGGSIGRTQPLRRPQSESRQQEERDQNVENPEAQEVMRQEVYGPHDALDLLYKAATDRYVEFFHLEQFISQLLFRIMLHLLCTVSMRENVSGVLQLARSTRTHHCHEKLY